ncbi:MAG: hypothetical protein V8R46_09670 [Eubacterium ramulus]
MTDIDWASIDWTNIFKLFRESAGEVIMSIVAVIIQIVRIVLLVYTAMAIGAAAKSHKVFYSVLTFIIILIIMGIIGTVTNISLIDMLSGSAAVNETAGGTAECSLKPETDWHQPVISEFWQNSASQMQFTVSLFFFVTT